jgi:hypothetical protein
MSNPRTSKRDNNYLSIANNAASIPYTLPLHLKPYAPESFDSILKFSKGTNVLTFDGVKIDQGSENVVDCNGAIKNVYIEGTYGEYGQKGDQVITAKGGCDGLAFRGEIRSRGNFCDVFLGSWSDENYDVTKNIDLSHLYRKDEKISIVVGRAEIPRYDKKYAKILFWKSIGAKIYWWTKFVYVKLLVSNFKFLQK